MTIQRSLSVVLVVCLSTVPTNAPTMPVLACLHHAIGRGCRSVAVSYNESGQTKGVGVTIEFWGLRSSGFMCEGA